MTRSRLAASAAVAAALLTVTACGGSSGTSSPAGSTGSSAAGSSSAGSAAESSSASASTASTSKGPSFVNGGAALADTGHLLYVLEAVNPKIGTNKNDLIAKSKALCKHVNANESATQLDADAAKGFTNGSWIPSPSEAEAIVGTVKAYGGC